VLVPPLYPIIDIDLCRIRNLDPDVMVEGCFAGGARLLQIRTKSAGGAAFLGACRSAVARGARYDALVIVNDRADIAALAGAAGVHVGQTDLSPAVVAAIAGPGAIVGVSTHTTEQVDEAVAGPARYVAVGPIFRTATKDTGYEPRGLELVRYAARLGKPVIGIGGISLENARSVIEAGASAVAVISDLISEHVPDARVRAYLDRISARPFNV
jgi:thiamine-phosphate pyrophosphorylase